MKPSNELLWESYDYNKSGSIELGCLVVYWKRTKILKLYFGRERSLQRGDKDERTMVNNNVTRMLDSQGISYLAYELPPEKLSAVEAAQFLHVDPELVYKTIVITPEKKGKPILALVPGPNEVNLKALARALGMKKVIMASQKQAEQITKLQAGGISPLALLNRGFQVVVDVSAESLEEIYISGGQRGLNIRLATSDLIKLTDAKIAIIGR